MILNFLVSLLSIILLFILLVVVIGYLLSCKPYKGPKTEHFDGKKFINPSRRPANGLKEVGEYGRTRNPDKWRFVADAEHENRNVPSPKEDRIQYTFINHSTFLIHIAGLNILTDPIWSERCSPFQWAGPKRMRPPGIAFENLPHIDLVLLSHNHYDHLDKNTIKRLVKKYNPTFIAPLGLSHLLHKYGCKEVHELDWWKETNYKQLKIKATPANHFSSRGIFDRDKTLWAGYIISTDKEKIYYAGDTGYSEVFKTIGQKEGPFDLSFIPIGAYLPKWFMSPIHISPDQSVLVHQDVKSKRSVAMHFGTFPLADDNPERSKQELSQHKEEAGLSDSEFMVPMEGQTYLLDNNDERL